MDPQQLPQAMDPQQLSPSSFPPGSPAASSKDPQRLSLWMLQGKSVQDPSGKLPGIQRKAAEDPEGKLLASIGKAVGDPYKNLPGDP